MSTRREREPIKVAVVGLGYWGPNLVRNLHEVQEALVAYVCDLRPAALQVVSRRYPAVKVTTSYQEVLDDESVEAVVIATPVSTHHRLASDALRAGKHVLVEKPLAASSAQAQDLIALAAERGLILMPGHTFLYSPPVNMIRDLIETGELGEIYFLSTSRVNLGLHQADVSVIWDLGPHDFSILRYWLDEMPARVSALSRDCIGSGAPDVAFINLEYQAGTIAHVELSWLAPGKLRRTTIVGSRKMVVYDDTSNEPVRVFDSGVNFDDPQTFGEYRLSYRTGDIVSPKVQPSEPLFLELCDFCNSIVTGSKPRSYGQLGLDVIRVIEAAEHSLTIAGNKVDIDSGDGAGLTDAGKGAVAEQRERLGA